MEKKLELLAPAGSPLKMKYAFKYGADAVYMGIPDFSLRVRINKFGLEDVKESIEYAHKLNKKIYVTVNIFAHNKHLDKLPEYLKKLNKWKPDALIISDPGVMQLAKQYAPDIPIHVSTQANATNWQAVKFWHDQGAERVILGREVTLEELKEIHKQVPECELEYFIHGAMCMSYSGRCILSAWLTGRSANLGDCTQPCRWKYQEKLQITNSNNQITKSIELEVPDHSESMAVEEDSHGTYVFNSKDMCMIEHLPELVDTGVVSFKIEGRAKSVAYLASVVKAYRQAFDLLGVAGSVGGKRRDLKKIKENILDKLVHRGYTTGFLFGRESVEQNVEDSHVGGEEEFVGEVIKTLKHKNIKATGQGDLFDIVVRPHNALRVGDKIRIMQPEGNDLEMVIDRMYNEDGQEIGSGHGGSGENVILKLGREMEEMSIIFKNNK